MGKCVFCKKKDHLQLECKWCEQKFCTRCLQYEVHKCPNAENMRRDQFMRLASILGKGKTVADKLDTRI